jgi:hypothetical protein
MTKKIKPPYVEKKLKEQTKSITDAMRVLLKFSKVSALVHLP